MKASHLLLWLCSHWLAVPLFGAALLLIQATPTAFALAPAVNRDAPFRQHHSWRASSCYRNCHYQSFYPLRAKDTNQDTTKLPRKTRTWEESYSLLVEFHQEQGHANVPSNYKEDPKLSFWVATQRKRRFSTSPDKIAKLEALNFTWDGAGKDKSNQRWENTFQRLQEYREAESHCCVPKNYEPDQKLANWVYTQRRYNTLGKLKPDRFKRLDSIGFVWRLKEFKNLESAIWEEQWEKKFDELLEYRKENGHCRVPQDFKGNQKLAYWVYTQRMLNVYGQLRQDRKERLEEISFIWNFEEIYDEAWMNKFNQLLECKEKLQIGRDGNKLRRQTWSGQHAQPELYSWEKLQQDFYKRGTLDSQRESLLAEIGYWDSLGPAKTSSVS